MRGRRRRFSPSPRRRPPGEFVFADARSVSEVERFLSEALGLPVRLPGVRLARGNYGRFLARVAGASAITFGSTIALAEPFARRLDERLAAPLRPSSAAPNVAADGGCLDALGELFVHECVHVWQYGQLKAPLFLLKYLQSYCTNITSGVDLSRAARTLAYRSIPFERQAYELAERWLRERS